MHHVLAPLTVIPTGLPWDAEATVVGILIAVLLLIAFGWLVPRWYIKALEKKYDYERETNHRNAETLKELTETSTKITDQLESVAKVMTSIQQGGGEER